MTKKLFKVYWCEYHNSANWGSKTKTKKQIIGALNFVIPEHKKIIVDVHWDPNEDDGWYECEVNVIFEAEDIDEARALIEDRGLYDDCSGIFTCFEKQNNKWIRSFTEEDAD